MNYINCKKNNIIYINTLEKKEVGEFIPTYMSLK